MLSRVQIDTPNQEQVENLKVSLGQGKGQATRSSIVSNGDDDDCENDDDGEWVLIFRRRKPNSYTSARIEM